MKIVFYSNFLNHHQLPLCMEFIKREDIQFTFVATEKIPQERLDMKYEDMNKKYSFVLCSYENFKNEKKALELAESADIVIIGSAPSYYIENRLKKNNKLTFRFCERSLKKGTWRRFIPKTYQKIYNDYIKYKKYNLYILGASAYTANDLVLCGFPKEKCYRWGYFPETNILNNCNKIISLKKENSIIWVGRFIEWKHPEVALKIAKNLKNIGIKFNLKMVGDGKLKEKLENYVKKNDLKNFVEFTGSISNEEVKKYMLETEIFLLTSDFYEGWGAVLNEAMNSMCVPVVSHSCGATAFLINSRDNGFVYKYGEINEALEYIKLLFKNCNLRKEMSKKAYNKILNEWNSKVAVERLLELVKKLLNEENSNIHGDGPCSISPIYKNNWYKKIKGK